MSRVGISADFHTANHRVLGGPVVAGVNLRCRLIGEAARRAFQLAGRVDCDYFVILGDVFDNGKPSPEVIGVMADAIASSPMPVYVIPGNHDCSSDELGNHALAALRKVANCRVVEEPTYLPDGVILAPYSPKPPVEYFGEVLRLAIPGRKFLLGHCGIIGQSTPIFLRDSKGAITVEQIQDLAHELRLLNPDDVDLRCCVTGDYHMHVEHVGLLDRRTVNIVQAGALCQVNFGDPPEVGRLCILDTEKGGVVATHDIPGPRFVKVLCTGGVMVFSEPRPGKDCDLFYSIECPTKEDAAAAEALMEEIAAKSPDMKLRGWKIELTPSQAQQTEVVEAVQSAVQVQEALGEWAAAQPVPEAVKQRATQIAEECLR